MTDAAEFAKRVLGEFPELATEFDDESVRGLPHVEVSTFADFVQRAKGQADWLTYSRAVRLIDGLLRDAKADLDNALHVSFLEEIDFDGPRGYEAWQHLTPRLQRAWRKINDGWGRPRPRWMT